MEIRLARYAVAATMAILTAAACSTPPPTGPSALPGPGAVFDVSGTVTGPKGLPMEGVSISAARAGSASRTAVTDATGSFVLSGLERGDWELVLRCPGYEERAFTAAVNGTITLALSLTVAAQH